MKIKNIFGFFAVALAAAAITACDDDTYDVVGNPNPLVYVPSQSGEYTVVQTPVGAFGSMEVKFNAKTNKPGADIKVTFDIDNSLVEAYNTENGTSYAALPEGAVTILNPTVNIPAGQCESLDSATVLLTEDDAVLATLTNKAGYVIPVVIKDAAGAQLATSVPTTNYLVINVIEKVIDEGATADNRKGQLVAERSGWSVSPLAGTSLSDGDGSAWFDGDDSNSATFSSESDEVGVIIDLGRVYNFDGMSASYKMWGYYSYGSFTHGMKIYISSDNSQWVECGALDLGSSWSNADFVGFYGAMPARYIKLIGVRTNDWYDPEIQCADFNIYATN